jgi:hypothetical protein
LDLNAGVFTQRKPVLASSAGTPTTPKHISHSI